MIDMHLGDEEFQFIKAEGQQFIVNLQTLSKPWDIPMAARAEAVTAGENTY